MQQIKSEPSSFFVLINAEQNLSIESLQPSAKAFDPHLGGNNAGRYSGKTQDK